VVMLPATCCESCWNAQAIACSSISNNISCMFRALSIPPLLRYYSICTRQLHQLHASHVPLFSLFSGGSITHLYPQPYGPRCVLADDQLTVALFSPLTDELTPLPGFDGSLELVSHPFDGGACGMQDLRG
jgi:hypothetical protein